MRPIIMRPIIMIAITGIAAAAAAHCLHAEAQTRVPSSPSLTYNGFNYVSYYNGAYANADSLPALVGTGANAAALTLDYGIDVQNSSVYSDATYTDSLTDLAATITEANSLGLSVMVRPLIDFLDPAKIGSYSVGDWRSFYNPTNAAAFFASYKTMIVNVAQVAQANGAAMLCIGAELDQLTGPAYLSYWTDIIASVRAVFSGKLTYSADWDDDISPWQGEHGLAAGTGALATQVSFWNQLDYLGIDVYAPISDVANPVLADLVAGWTSVPTDPTSYAVTGNQSLVSYFESVATTTGKPLIFTEIGYESASDAALQPAGTSTNIYDPALQANLYAAFFEAWQLNNALTGVYFWNWDPDVAEVGPGNGPNFSPQEQPAQAIVTANFAALPYTLAAIVTGSGTVTSSPSGVNCPTTCSLPFSADSLVTLVATPANGWSFGGWGGACSGTGACSVTMTMAQGVSAIFTQTTQPSALQLSGPAISASGYQGGPFSPASFGYTLTSSSGGVGYSISNVPSWLTPSATSGTATATPTTVTFTVNAGANGLSAATYSQAIAFTNTTNNQGTTSAQATLTVVAPPSSGQPQPQGVRTFVSGAGTDSGDCARTAPCRTFAYAMTQTVASGEISVLDTAGYGALTINKAVSIVNPSGVEAGIAVAAGGTAITVAAGADDIVALRGLTIEGAQTGLNGIVLTAGGVLEIDNCVVRDFTGTGILLAPTAATAFRIGNTVASDNGQDGVLVQPQGAGTAQGVLDHVTASRNASNGIVVDGTMANGASTVVAVTDSVASGNTNYGIYSYSGSAMAIVIARRTTASGNSIGFYQYGTGGVLQIGKSEATGNSYGVAGGGGTIFSFEDNIISNNTNANVSGSLTTIAKQ
jgi:glycosyl hydrolase family 113/parallel beta helix pectate lyase-like protein/List-Bact-rpt repeat protein